MYHCPLMLTSTKNKLCIFKAKFNVKLQLSKEGKKQNGIKKWNEEITNKDGHHLWPQPRPDTTRKEMKLSK